MKVTNQKRIIAISSVLIGISNAFSVPPNTRSNPSSSSTVILKETKLDGLELTSKTKNQKDLPKYSQSIPFLKRPKHLTMELAGDVGFDPLDFATNPDLLMEYREAEIKHGRLAMLASAGWVFAELFDEPIASYIGMDPLLESNDRVPSVLNGGLDKVSPLWWGFCIGLTAAIDLYGVQRARTATEGYKPGDLGFDPLNLYPEEEDIEGRENIELAEIKHCRLAMIAVTAFAVQEFVSKVGIVDETPWFFRPVFETARPFLEGIVTGVN